MGKERPLGTAEVEGAEWKEVTGGHRETLLVRNTGGEEMVDRKLAEKQPSTAVTASWSLLGGHPRECTLLHGT